MKSSSALARIRTWIQGVLLVCFAGASLYGVLAFSDMVIFSRLNGEQPASLRSPLHANYGVDDRAMVFPALNFNLVEQAIREQVTGTMNANDRITTVIGQMKTSVATVTPYFSITPVFTASPTQSEASQTATCTLAFSPTGTLSSLETLTLTPTVTTTGSISITFTPTWVNGISPTPSMTPTRIPTFRPGSVTPTSLISATFTWTATLSIMPTSTVTLPPRITPSDTLVPTRTTHPTATPTYTLMPSFTPSQTQAPTRPPTRTPTPVPYPPPHTATPGPTTKPTGTAYP